MTPVTTEEIQDLSQLIFDISGIYLDKDKGYLLETRLKPLLNSQGHSTLGELYTEAKADSTGKLAKQIVEAITTNETYFFRDHTPFDLMRNKIIPELIDRRSTGGGRIALRIWSAACSTGQEVYSIAMTLCEMVPDLARYDIHILGTDISNKVIAQASYGKYNQFEMERGLPPHYRQRYFSPLGPDWRIKDEIRGMAEFRILNLMKPFSDLGGKFDLIFCRNVAIYFNQPDKIRLFQKLARVLAPDGALIIGGSETLTRIAPEFEPRNYLKGIFYQLAGVSALPPLRAAVPGPLPIQPLPIRRPTPEPRPARPYSPPLRTPSPVAVNASPEPAPQPEPTVHNRPPPPALPSTGKKSLLASIRSSQQKPTPLLNRETGSTTNNLLSQLNSRKKQADE